MLRSAAMQRSDQGDELVPKKPEQSEFEKSYAPGTAPHTPVKLGAKEYDADLWDSPLMRTLKRAVAGWPLPPDAPAPGRALRDDDPRLAPTARLPGREAWRKALQQLIVSSGAAQAKPAVYAFVGACSPLIARLVAERVLPAAVARIEFAALLPLIPEHSVLVALGDGRAAEVVRDEAAALATAAYAQALTEKRDVLWAPASLEGLRQAKQAGFRRVVVAVGDRDVARDFDALVKESDELVLFSSAGGRLEVLAQGKAGDVQVRQERPFQQFKAMREP